jgi:hypothetical protein
LVFIPSKISRNGEILKNKNSRRFKKKGKSQPFFFLAKPIVKIVMSIDSAGRIEIVIILILNAVEKVITCTHVVYDLLTAVAKIANITDLPLEKVGWHASSQKGLLKTPQLILVSYITS